MFERKGKRFVVENHDFLDFFGLNGNVGDGNYFVVILISGKDLRLTFLGFMDN
jgi:hypothetical protein